MTITDSIELWEDYLVRGQFNWKKQNNIWVKKMQIKIDFPEIPETLITVESLNEKLINPKSCIGAELILKVFPKGGELTEMLNSLARYKTGQSFLLARWLVQFYPIEGCPILELPNLLNYEDNLF